MNVSLSEGIFFFLFASSLLAGMPGMRVIVICKSCVLSIQMHSGSGVFGIRFYSVLVNYFLE